MKIAIVSDEISLDFGTAVELATSWGIRWFEIRRLPSGRVPMVQEYDMERVTAVMKETGVKISSLSPGLFKIAHDDPQSEVRLREYVPRACELAHRFGTDLLVDFSFTKPGLPRQKNFLAERETCPENVIELIGRVADAVAAGGCRLLLENEAICWGDTGVNIASIVDRLDRPNVFVNWDPGNALNAGEKAPYPEGYNAVKKLIAHVHVKDYTAPGGKCAPAGEGMIDWRGQIQALLRDGYTGFLVVETHFRPKVEGSRRATEALKNIICDIL